MRSLGWEKPNSSEAAVLIGCNPSMGIVLGTAMILKAVKPSATAAHARFAKRLALYPVSRKSAPSDRRRDGSVCGHSRGPVRRSPSPRVARQHCLRCPIEPGGCQQSPSPEQCRGHARNAEHHWLSIPESRESNHSSLSFHGSKLLRPRAREGQSARNPNG